MTQDRLVDVGAARERTQMAWTRTGLAVLATAAIGVRLLLSGPLWLVAAVALLGVLGGSSSLLLAHRRYGSVQRHLPAAATSPTAELPPVVGRTATLAVVLLSVLLALGSLDGGR